MLKFMLMGLLTFLAVNSSAEIAGHEIPYGRSNLPLGNLYFGKIGNHLVLQFENKIAHLVAKNSLAECRDFGTAQTPQLICRVFLTPKGEPVSMASRQSAPKTWAETSAEIWSDVPMVRGLAYMSPDHTVISIRNGSAQAVFENLAVTTYYTDGPQGRVLSKNAGIVSCEQMIAKVRSEKTGKVDTVTSVPDCQLTLPALQK